MTDITVTTDAEQTEEYLPNTLEGIERELQVALKALPPRQRAFVREMAKGRTQIQSALNAGYATTTAHSQSYKLLVNLGVRRAVSLQRRSDQIRHGVSAQTIRDGLLEIAETA